MNNKDLLQLQQKILDSEGAKCIARKKYHNTTVGIFLKNYKELSEAILHFENYKNSLELFDQNKPEGREKYYNEITRLLHNFLASAKTLIEHTRIFLKKYYLNTKICERYKEKVKKEFEDDELSRFIQDLRNYILHRRFAIYWNDFKTLIGNSSLLRQRFDA